MLKAVLAAVCLCAVAGCYSTANPIDAAPQTDLDSRVVGGWRCMFANPDANSVFALEVKRSVKDPRQYDATTMVTGGELGHFRAYGSLAGGIIVVNLQALDADAGETPWTFLRYAFLAPNLLKVDAVDEDAVEGLPDTPGALRKRLEATDAANLFAEAFVCLRLE